MAQLAIQQILNQAVRHHQTGRLKEAEQLYRQVLARQPANVDAMHLLGLAALQAGRSDIAADLISRAVALRPNFPEAFYNLGNALKNTGRVDEAIAAYRRAISLKLNFPEVHSNLGNALKDKGQLDEAIDAYRNAIAVDPKFPQAHNNLGGALKDKGQLDEAIAAFRQAIALNPNLAEAHSNLGNVLKDKGQLDEAIAACRRAITLNPKFPEVHTNLGNALKEKGKLDEAITAYRQAIALNSNFPQTYCNLGGAFMHKGEVDEAIAVYRQAIALRPDYAEAHSDLGNALKEKGQLNEAIAACRRAIALRPGYAEAYSNLGNALTANGQLDESIAACRQAIALRPDLLHAYGNLGNALAGKGELDEAIAAFRQAVALNPGVADVYNNLGIALKDKGQLDEAMAAFRQAIALNPDLSDAHNNLGVTLKDTGRLDETISAYRQAITLRPNHAETHGNLVFAMQYHPGYDAKAIAEEERRWNDQHAEPLRKLMQPHTNDRDPDRRLRIGYVSPDFRDHVVGQNLLPLFKHHDRPRFEIICYSNVIRPDVVTGQLQQMADDWRNIVGQTDEQVARQIREDQIDILVDLALHTGHNRLLVFARKPAPVQVSYLGYCGSTGMSAMDYRFSDPYLDPAETDLSCYSEKTLRLPRSYWCYQPTVAAAVSASPALNNGFVTFGCLNNFAKVSVATVDLWARILAALPNSRLILHAHPGKPLDDVTQRLERAGIANTRLLVVGKQTRTDYLQTYSRIDIALDPFPYSGGITSCDALWMGVPVVSLSGQTAVGRGGRSILSNLGLTELIAFMPDQYVHIAIELAKDRDRMESLRRGMRARMQTSALMDAAGFARDVEAAYRQMWRAWCAGDAK